MATVAGQLVSGALGANGTSSPFQPIPGRPFNVWITGTFSATVTPVRSQDAGVTWVPVAKTDLSAVATFTVPITFTAFEPDGAVLWAVQVSSWVSGSVGFQFDT